MFHLMGREFVEIKYLYAFVIWFKKSLRKQFIIMELKSCIFCRIIFVKIVIHFPKFYHIIWFMIYIITDWLWII